MVPQPDCELCPRLADFRKENRELHSRWHNKPVASFGSLSSEFLIVGLAPGLRGANKTGRPFTGDFAGDLLYKTLKKYEFSAGVYTANTDDGLSLINCRITNTVRCVPPKNLPSKEEIKTCKNFLFAEIEAMKNLRVLLALGHIAHDAIVSLYSLRKTENKFTHGGKHSIKPGVVLYDSYHCSRYNTNTRRLTPAMFEDVFLNISLYLKKYPPY